MASSKERAHRAEETLPRLLDFVEAEPNELGGPRQERKAVEMATKRMVKVGLFLAVLCMVAFLAGIWTIWKPGLHTDTDFRHYRKQLEEVVALARRDALTSTDYNHHFRHLPRRYQHLSDGGEVVVEKPATNLKVFFFTSRGFLDSGAAGFLYTADDRPAMYEFPRVRRFEKKAPNWYFVTSD